MQPWPDWIGNETPPFQRMVEQARAAGVVPVWVFLPSTKAYPEPPAEDVILRRLAEEAGFEIIDLYDLYNEVRPEDFWVRPWDDHPNTSGHRLIAERLEVELKNIPAIMDLLAGAEGQPARQ